MQILRFFLDKARFLLRSIRDFWSTVRVEEELMLSSDLQRVGFKRFEARPKMSIRVLEDAEAIFDSREKL